MNLRFLAGAFFLLSMLAACSSYHGETPGDSAPAERIARADSLGAAGHYDAALGEYRSLIEFFPASRYAPSWIRQMALLSSAPGNARRDDSAALQWFRAYALLPAVTPQEKEDTGVIIRLLEEHLLLSAELQKRQARADTLAVQLDKNNAELALRAKRIKELEAELKSISDELQRLREVDIHISKKGKPF
jgi:hypothetical protein